MKRIIDWLISMEQMAGALYTDAAGMFERDGKLNSISNNGVTRS